MAQIETFKCPGCGAENNVEFAPGETQRTIPCTTCYYEEWEPALVDPDSIDPQTGKATRMIPDSQKKIEHGTRFTVVKGQGVVK